MSHPLAPTSFVGRRRELADVRQALASARLVTLTGVGGAGKTRLARRVVEAEAGVEAWTVALADVLDPDVVELAVVRSLGLQLQTPVTPVDAIVDLVGDRRVLLVLDNCEQVRRPVGTLVMALLERCARLRILTTSRQSLGVSGEVVYLVPPLSVPERDAEIHLVDLPQYDGVQLFLQRAAAGCPSYEPTEEDAHAIGQLCAALDGIPLAIELAAARICALSPHAMLERLSAHYELLSRGYADTPERHRSLHASMAWSFELCTEPERLLWARLSVFAGGFGLDAAEQVCGGAGLPSSDVLDVLSDLIDKSIVTRVPGPDPHYVMLETLRQFGEARLAEAGELEVYQQRHRRWFLDMALRLGLEWMGPEQARRVEHWRRNHANLRLILEDTASHPADAPVALRLVMALEGYWLVTGLLAEERYWLDLALENTPTTAPERAPALCMCAYLGSIAGEADYSQDRLAEAERLLAGVDDDLAVGYLAFAAGSTHLFAGDMKAAVVEAERCIELFQRCGHVNHAAVAHMIAGLCHSALGDEAAAARSKAEALRLTESTGELYTRSQVLWSLAVDALHDGDVARADGLLREALGMKAALRDQPGLAVVLGSMARVASAGGDGERAAMLLGAADAIWSFIPASPASAPFIAADRQAAEDLARELLDEERFDQCFRTGRGLSSQEAIALADGSASLRPERPVLRSAAGDRMLTPRESEVARLLGQGLSNQEIADRLVISIRTAQGHVENILRKLNFGSRSQVAAWVATHDVDAR